MSSLELYTFEGTVHHLRWHSLPLLSSRPGRLHHITATMRVQEPYLTVANSCLTSSLEGMTFARAATAVLTDGQAAATMQ